VTVASNEPKIANRDQLLTALKTGAEVEHLLCCEYLYAGFSIRRSLADFPPGGDESAHRVTLDRATPWLAQLYQIARQEMEHLGIVCNLLAAVGAEPHFERPNFPQPANRSLLNVPYCLDRFGLTSVQRFVWYERPENLTPAFPATAYGLEAWNPVEVAPLPVHALGIGTIEELYDEIENAFQILPAAEIFLGNPERQLGNVFSHRVRMAGMGNREEAKRAIHQIQVEGEGIGRNPLTSNSHFQRFTNILAGLEDAQERNPQSDPALPVVTNPLVEPHPEEFPASLIRRPETVAVMRLFNGCYHAMLVMLKTFLVTYSRSFTPQPPPQAALFYAAFFPLMTMVIRPLGEMLARMPAGDEYPDQNAGASFEIEEPITLQLEVDWYRDRLNTLAARARDLVDAVPDRLRPKMQGLFENLTSTNLHLQNIWQQGGE
jgi:hypothetical protein